MMLRHLAHLLSCAVERMAELSPPQQRELVQGMLAELNSLSDEAERARFALGAIAAIARLAIGGYLRPGVQTSGVFVRVGESLNATDDGGVLMSRLTTTQLLRRHASPFVVAFTALTLTLIANYSVQHIPQLRARDFATIVEVLLLSVPFTLAMTVPMAVFLAVSWVFMRLGAEGVLAAARQERHGIRRLIAPVMFAAAVVSTFTLFSNTLLLPRANVRLAAELSGANHYSPTRRSMTISELHAAATIARNTYGADAALAVGYEVEIQKKFALAAACLILALAAAATSIRFPRGGAWLMLGASGIVFTGYYCSLVVGESLAERQVVSPLAAMWIANVFVLAVAVLLIWQPNRFRPSDSAQTLPIGT
jgi:lipopolysaccharide export LptBFGC system permease protein LptF